MQLFDQEFLAFNEEEQAKLVCLWEDACDAPGVGGSLPFLLQDEHGGTERQPAFPVSLFPEKNTDTPLETR